MEFIIVSGMSGSGKSLVARALEDIGFFCIDNIPVSLIQPVAELSMKGQSDLGRIAIIVDIRGGRMFNELLPTLNEMKKNNIDFKLLFLDTSNEKLVTRYKETRRSHPLTKGNKMTLPEAVAKERHILYPLRETADYIIDTTTYSTAALKERITELFLGNVSKGMSIQCVSFGFKNGCVPEADIVFDVRCLKNPFYVDELRAHTGLEQPVKDFVMALPEANELIKRIYSLIDYSVPLYCKEGKSQLVIAVGCTGGKHRSVIFAELIHEHLLENGYHSVINHRDIRKE